MKPDVPLVNIMDLLLDAVCVVDQQGRFVYVSAASERIFGYTPEEMHGRNPLDLVHPDDRAHTAAAISEISAGNAKPYFENRYIRKDGQIAHIMWSARFAPEDQYRVAVAHDISERKYAEFIHKAQYEISEAAHSEDDLQALFKSIHATITEFLTADRFYIALRGGTDEALEYAYYYDVTEQVPEQTPAADTFCVEVMRTDAPLLQISAAIAAGTNNSQLMTSRLGVPLSMNNTTLGALIMQHSSQAMSYSDKDKEFLQFVSTQIATAVERKKLQTQMRYMALHDVLTGLPNRVLFQDRLRLALARARRETALLAVLYLDLDKFKQVNDDFGHAVGDALLQESAQRLRDCLREVDTVARIGGDEFVILLENINRHEDIERVVSKIQAAFMLEFAVENRVLKIAPSIGIAVYPQDGDDDQQLLRHADDAMYAAKPK
ncbi:MAG: diguanylate cyclase [Gammaproteobacteria bacterium]